ERKALRLTPEQTPLLTKEEKSTAKTAKAHSSKTSQFISQAIIRATQRTVRFIRWLQAALYDPGPIEQTLARLKRVWCLRKS
ncbi:MAG: hypothetical protein HC767_04275, partial [Akkermansiaceae bacterium]|nr:hypothetical protein [Akkermansiaceae bacterium]